MFLLSQGCGEFVAKVNGSAHSNFTDIIRHSRNLGLEICNVYVHAFRFCGYFGDFVFFSNIICLL